MAGLIATPGADDSALASSGDTDARIYEGDFGGRKGKKGEGVELLFEYAESENIAEGLGPDRLARIGAKVVRDYQIDKESRREWEIRCEDAMKLAMQVSEEKSYPWPKASNVKFPLMTTAAIQFAARAYPAIIAGKDIVKAKVLGSDRGVPAAAPASSLGAAPGPGGGVPGQGNGIVPPASQGGAPPSPTPGGAPVGVPGTPPTGVPPEQPQGQGSWQQGAPVDGAPDQQWLILPGAKRARGDRVSRHMSYQLTEEMEDWEEQTDKMLHIIPIVGCAFRKVWFDPHLDRNRSEVVQAKDLVVNYSARSLETAPRITHVGPAQALYPYEIVERERMGLWLHIETGPASSEDGSHQADDDDAPHQFLEQHRYLDLDDDGYQEPYIVTVHKETQRVVRIVARYDAESILQNAKGEVAKIDADHYFIKYPFIPSPDGAFYDVGFGTLLNPINESVNTTLNQMLDAGHLQNTGGGFIGRGLRLKGGAIRFRPGEWKPVDVQGKSVKDNVVPLPFPGASQTLFQLLGLLIEAGRDITSVKDVMTGGEGPKNEAASRTLARIEQGMKVFTAIYKRLYRAWKKELKLLFLLNSRYLNPDTYFTFQDDPEAIGPEDYNSEEMDIIPVADPAVITDMQRMARGEFLMQFLDDAYFDPREMRERILASVSVDDIDRLLIKGEPEPDSSLLAEADKIDIEKKKLEIERSRLDLEADKVLMELTKMESEVILNLAKAEAQEAGPQMAEYKNMADVIRERVKAASAERMATEKAAQAQPPTGA